MRYEGSIEGAFQVKSPNNDTGKDRRKTRRITSQAITKRIRKESLSTLPSLQKNKLSSTKLLVEAICQVPQLWSIRPYREGMQNTKRRRDQGYSC